MNDIPSIFGSMVFNDAVMRARLPRDIYDALKTTIAEGKRLKPDVANVVANAMKNWATEKGATHYTHWFQPMTGITAEKHDSFVSPDDNGGVIMEFSGRELIRGEPDASSFPSGGLRATFEARGYTAWDPTSYAFIKDSALCIPTAYCSYSGEALDKKTPLLRSMEALDKQALRILRLFGNNAVKHVTPTVGAEQEYFLIDRDMYLKRPDLVYCGRTLFGARPSRGQDLDDHYYGALKPRVAAFMAELDTELWKLGILAKTEHNEVAPGQHELAPVYTTANIAADHNQLTMELMKKIANKHGLTCLLHEKPFAGVNGSGKHNNWSMYTDTGVNLLEPGETPSDDAQFLLFLTAVIKAVDDYQDLLRASVASAGNDHRLGANEAPPWIVSVFLGDELTDILSALENGGIYQGGRRMQLQIGATVLPRIPKDTTDRNRTSPFAFTGNRFEFRMLGSAFSLADPNIVLNTAVAEVLSLFADELETEADFVSGLAALIKRTICGHKRIIFNGNGYDGDWVQEAEARGLLNLKTTPDAMSALIVPKNISLFERHCVFSEQELRSRYNVFLESYSKTISIEALTIIELVNREIIPAVIGYENELCELVDRKRRLGPGFAATPEESRLMRICDLTVRLETKLAELTDAANNSPNSPDSLTLALHCRDRIFSAMSGLRMIVDELELLVSKKNWTLPTYGEILYSVN